MYFTPPFSKNRKCTGNLIDPGNILIDHWTMGSNFPPSSLSVRQHLSHPYLICRPSGAVLPVLTSSAARPELSFAVGAGWGGGGDISSIAAAVCCLSHRYIVDRVGNCHA